MANNQLLSKVLKTVYKNTHHHFRLGITSIRFNSNPALETDLEDSKIRFIKSMTPWQVIPYSEQLSKKKQFCGVVATKLKNLMTINIGKQNHCLPFLEHIKKHNGLAFTPPDLIPSPVIAEYRNKDYPVIGPGIDGTPQVGFYIRPLKGKTCQEVALENTRMTKTEHYELMKAFREVVVNSNIPAHGLQRSATGHWKQLCIRSNRQGELMVAAVVHPEPGDSKTGLSDKARDLTLNFFQNGPGTNFNVKSLFFQQSALRRCTDGSHPYELLDGADHIEETLSGCTFKISPDTFFQINTEAAEVMYDVVRDISSLNKNTVLLDICCGTGTIGIVLGRSVRHVVGIERVPQAVKNAISNAAANNLDNTCYICGSAEKYMSRLLDQADLQKSDADIVAVVNPSRSGLGQNLLRALRNCEAIKKVVYISCKPSGRALLNFHWLCHPPHKPDKKIVGAPFLPTDVRAVDMFPDTKHFELIILFER